MVNSDPIDAYEIFIKIYLSICMTFGPDQVAELEIKRGGGGGGGGEERQRR